MTLPWILFAVLGLAAIAAVFGFVYRRRQRILSLDWPTQLSHGAFVRACDDFLTHIGWAVEYPPQGPYDLVASKPDLRVILVCRTSGFTIGPSLTAKALGVSARLQQAVVIVARDPLSDAERAIFLQQDIDVLHYTELTILGDVAENRFKQLTKQTADRKRRVLKR